MTPTDSGVSVSNISQTRWSLLFPSVAGPEPFWLRIMSRTTETCNAKVFLPRLRVVALSPKLAGENAAQLEERRRESTTLLMLKEGVRKDGCTGFGNKLMPDVTRHWILWARGKFWNSQRGWRSARNFNRSIDVDVTPPQSTPGGGSRRF